MKIIALVTLLLAGLVPALDPALGQERYATRPPVVLSPDLTAPWVMQLQQPRTQARGQHVNPSEGAIYHRVPAQRAHRQEPPAVAPVPAAPPPAVISRPATPASAAGLAERPVPSGFDPKFLPQQVVYSGGHAPGTIVIDTRDKFLYLVGANGEARRYGVGVGKEGFEWKGSETITRKAEWPDWRPPATMIAREKAKGRILPAHMPGGPENPLGARALYLGSTLYRIHGTNQPWSIGQAVSSGCIRMRNEDVIDLYERVNVGSRVVVL